MCAVYELGATWPMADPTRNETTRTRRMMNRIWPIREPLYDYSGSLLFSHLLPQKPKPQCGRGNPTEEEYWYCYTEDDRNGGKIESAFSQPDPNAVLVYENC